MGWKFNNKGSTPLPLQLLGWLTLHSIFIWCSKYEAMFTVCHADSTVHAFPLIIDSEWVSEWVREEFLNSTSALYRLFSAVQLRAEEKQEIHRKCIKQNKWYGLNGYTLKQWVTHSALTQFLAGLDTKCTYNFTLCGPSYVSTCQPIDNNSSKQLTSALSDYNVSQKTSKLKF